MQRAIERLKASRAKSERAKSERARELARASDDRYSGIEAGKTWAMRDAEWDTLCDLIEMRDFFKEAPPEVKISGFCSGLAPHGNPEKRNAEKLFGRPFNEISEAMVEGFVIGAQLVKEAVEENA